MSKIEWTGETWNPIVGCSLASPGCTNCYAMKMAKRLEAMAVPAYQGLTQDSKAGPVWTGKVEFSESALLKPLQRKKAQTYFVNSMGDLFHEDCSDEWIDRVFAVMALCPQHTFQVLTKRSMRMREYVTEHKESGRWLLFRHPVHGHHIFDPIAARFDAAFQNVWLGVSVEDQARADERIPDLLATPAAVRFISAEPLLGPVKAWIYMEAGRAVDWVIVGGESGKGARPMHPDWARSLRDQCADAGVPFFFKQWGEWREVDGPKTKVGNRLIGKGTHWLTRDGKLHPRTSSFSIYDEYKVAKLGKKLAGRLLDGVEHNGMPGQP